MHIEESVVDPAAKKDTSGPPRETKLIGEMQQETESTGIETSRARFPGDLVLLPPVSTDDLKRDTEHDPEGAEEFVALLRQLRQTDSRTVAQNK